MSSQIPSVDEQMALSRTFGHVNEGVYSPVEYAAVVGPILEHKIRTGPIGVSNSYLEPHNRGVNLTVVCERTFYVRPANRGTPINEVLHESGQPVEKDFEKFLGELFESAEKLESVTINDQLGNSFTVRREDVNSSKTQALNENQPLDLSMLEEGGSKLSPSFRSAPGRRGPLREARLRNRDIEDAVELLKHNGYRAPITVQHKGPDFIRILAAGTSGGNSTKMQQASADIFDELRVKVEAFQLDSKSDAFVLINGSPRGNTWEMIPSLSEGKRGVKGKPINERYGYVYDVDRMGNVTIADPDTGRSVYVQGEEGAELADELDRAPNNRARDMILSQYADVMESSQSQAASMYKKGYRYRVDFSSGTPSIYMKTMDDIAKMMRTDFKDEKQWKATEIGPDGSDKTKEALERDVRQFLGEKADFAGAADKLLKDSQIGSNAHDLGYGGYLRRMAVGKKCSHLLRHENEEIAAGAAKARKDVTALANALKDE